MLSDASVYQISTMMSLESILDFLIYPYDANVNIHVVHQKQVLYSIWDTLVLVRGCSRNAARIQWRKIVKKHGNIPHHKHIFNLQMFAKEPITSFENLLLILSFLKGYHGEFFTHAFTLLVANKRKTPRVKENDPNVIGELHEINYNALMIHDIF